MFFIEILNFGAGDDTGVYWNEGKEYSREVMLFFAIAMEKSLFGKFFFGKKLRSSQSLDFKILLPTKNGEMDIEFMENFITETQTRYITERIAELETYLSAFNLKNGLTTQLSEPKQKTCVD